MKAYTGQITIDSIGTGGGFERFCKTGETDIANASRAIKDAEIENCTPSAALRLSSASAPTPWPWSSASENDFLTDVTKEELAMIFSDRRHPWSDVRPEWPAEDILRFSPGTDSGTFDYFVEAVMDPALRRRYRRR